MLLLKSVVIESSVVCGDCGVGGFGQLEGGEGVHEHEGQEVGTVLRGAEHVLVEQEVSS